MIKRFRKKMPIIEAVEFIDTTENLDEITEFLSDKGIKEFKVDYSDRNNPVLIVEKEVAGQDKINPRLVVMLEGEND